MSGSSIYARGKHNASAFIMSCVRKAFSEHTLHRRWLPAEQLRMFMHMKYEIGEDIQFPLSTMMRVINKMLPMTSSVPNILEISGGSRLQVFLHSFQNRTRRYFFWVTTEVGVIPSLPSQRHATSWEEDCVLTRLLAGGRANPLVLTSLFSTNEEPTPKRQKGSSTVVDEANTPHPSNVSQQSTSDALSLSTANDWWESGDARRLFAPGSTAMSSYDADCCVKTIVMERIEQLESVNRAAGNWNFIVERIVGSSSSSGESQHRYSEADVFALRYRSMYLAIALKQFVLHVTGDMRTQWTWKRSLQFAIKVMNDVGVEFYSSFSTLSRWHRKFARNRYYFHKTPEAKHACPRFFVDNPDAMEAFKKHGVANIKDLRVEMMLEFVHSQLIPKLMMRREGSLFDDNGDEDQEVVGVQAEVAPTTKQAFLQSYGLSTLSITTMARWMHACGFRYKKREKHNFVDGHERPETLAYRPVFTKKYIDDEIRAHRWLQMTLIESRELESNGRIVTNCGYNYVVDDIDMVEYHIDTSYAFE